MNFADYFQRIYPRFEICHIHYFKALVLPNQRNPEAQLRQKTYWRALQTLPNLTIHEGKFYQNPKEMRLAHPPYRLVVVNKIEEKQTDVHIASRMLVDAFRGNCDVSILVSNDSDLSVTVRILRNEMARQVYVLNPHLAPAYELTQSATEIKSLRLGPLKACQFPEKLEDAAGTFEIPETWRPLDPAQSRS